MLRHQKLYDEIEKFSEEYGCRKFNDDKNMAAYMKLVDMCIDSGLIPKANRTEFSTHRRLDAAITYRSNRLVFCNKEV